MFTCADIGLNKHCSCVGMVVGLVLSSSRKGERHTSCWASCATGCCGGMAADSGVGGRRETCGPEGHLHKGLLWHSQKATVLPSRLPTSQMKHGITSYSFDRGCMLGPTMMAVF